MTPVNLEAVAAADAWPAILAVDPGAMHTGVCLRVGLGAWEAVTVDRTDEEREADHAGSPKYATRVLATVRELLKRHQRGFVLEAGRRGTPVPPARIAVETLVPPTPRHRSAGGVGVSRRVLGALPGTANVLGAVVGAYPAAILVPPAGSSRGWDELPPELYPDNLRGRTPPGWLAGGSERRHQRAAWAIAGQAALVARVAAPSAVAPAGSAVQVGATNLNQEGLAEPRTGDAETPTPERAAQLRLQVTRRVAVAPAAGALPGDPTGLLAAIHRAVRALPDATAAEGDWLRSRLGQLAAATVVHLLEGRPEEEVRAAAKAAREGVEQLVSKRRRAA